MFQYYVKAHFKIKTYSILPKHFFSSPNQHPEQDNFGFNLFFLKNQKYEKYLEAFPKPPLNFYFNTSKKLEKPSLLSYYFLERLLLKSEIKQIEYLYRNFLFDLQNFNEKNLEKTLEGNYYKHVMNFLEVFQNSNLIFKVLEPKSLIFNVMFVINQAIQGVFIERFLNYAKTQYFSKDSFLIKTHQFSGAKKNKNLDNNKDKRIKRENLIHDEELLNRDIEILRKDYKIQQVIVKIQTNLKLNILEKKEKKIIFGSDDEEIIETRYLQIENKHGVLSFRQSDKKFIITDVDNILKGNTHFI